MNMNKNKGIWIGRNEKKLINMNRKKWIKMMNRINGENEWIWIGINGEKWMNMNKGEN